MFSRNTHIHAHKYTDANIPKILTCQDTWSLNIDEKCVVLLTISKKEERKCLLNL